MLLWRGGAVKLSFLFTFYVSIFRVDFPQGYIKRRIPAKAGDCKKIFQCLTHRTFSQEDPNNNFLANKQTQDVYVSTLALLMCMVFGSSKFPFS